MARKAAQPASAGDESSAPAASTAPEGASGESVRALVLHDSIYGKCGEVREFNVALVAALKDAGYIDPHPNAVASAGG